MVVASEKYQNVAGMMGAMRWMSQKVISGSILKRTRAQMTRQVSCQQDQSLSGGFFSRGRTNLMTYRVTMQHSASEGVSMSRRVTYILMNQAFIMIVWAKMLYLYGKAVMCLSPAAIQLDGWSVDVHCFFVREGNSKGSLSLNKSKKSTINGKIAKKSAIQSH
jgi:hypothetical protein